MPGVKRYDCTKVLDYYHEFNRMCHSSTCVECGIGDEKRCGDVTNETIAAVQKWSDEHPVLPKITREEQLFLEAFKVDSDKSIERRGDHLWLRNGYFRMELWATMFPFIEDDEAWSVEVLLRLEVEEDD